ncbi:hypothetical protein TNCV_1269421 [Trichonephila clavipes]|nr:hypothetical protein TNCV_1269421 [Trichonephila clavipes]
MSDLGPRNSSWQMARSTPVVSHNFEHYPDENSIWLSSITTLNPGGDQRPPSSLLLPSTSREDLQLNGYLVYHATWTLYIYKYPCLLQDLNLEHYNTSLNVANSLSDGQSKYVKYT